VKKEVVMCDFQQGFAPTSVERASWSKACDRVADGECPICKRDACPEHKSCFLRIVLETESPKKKPPDNPSEFMFHHVRREASARICHECHQFLFGLGHQGQFAIHTVLDPALAGTIELVQSISAAQRLTPEDPKK
jgi:hypothetical protein